MTYTKNPAAVALGRLGGAATSDRKTAAVAANGAAGGRPAVNGIYRAYDTTTEWMGRPRATAEAAQADADRHTRGCESQGGYGSAIVVRRDDGGTGDHCETLDGETVWPPHGRSSGAVRWA
jgi:hypothetical protein